MSKPAAYTYTIVEASDLGFDTFKGKLLYKGKVIYEAQVWSREGCYTLLIAFSRKHHKKLMEERQLNEAIKKEEAKTRSQKQNKQLRNLKRLTKEMRNAQ